MGSTLTEMAGFWLSHCQITTLVLVNIAAVLVLEYYNNYILNLNYYLVLVLPVLVNFLKNEPFTQQQKNGGSRLLGLRPLADEPPRP